MSDPMASEAKAINLIMPVIKWTESDNPLAVHRWSRRQHRRAVWKIAQFFRHEFQFDFTQYGYDGADDDPDHVAYLWVPQGCALAGWRTHCIGATCFRKRDWGMAMQWIWIHPFFRRKGLLTAAWPQFIEKHGNFAVETPLSEAMETFLKKVNHAGQLC